MTVSPLPAAEGADRLTFWQGRWNENNIGWHESDLHEAWRRFGHLLIPSSAADFATNADAAPTTTTTSPLACSATQPVRVFFPLCGKTVDMAHLARRAAHTPNSGIVQVVGVDGVLKPLETFASEHPDLEIQLAASSSESATTTRLVGKNILLLQTDFFHLDETRTDGRFEAIFDRASLVAIPPALREQYVGVMSRLIQPGGRILLIVIERTGGDLNAGPPFSVPEAEVRRLYEGQDWVESITLLDDNAEVERNVGRNMKSLFFLIQTE